MLQDPNKRQQHKHRALEADNFVPKLMAVVVTG